MPEPYYQDNLIALYNKDCQDMPELEDESIDLVVTDPPYGYSFMGKDWDKAVIPIGIWKECLRVLKSGAFAFVMCSPRQDCLGKMICNLSDAGFETGFTSLYWAYASGFPKAQNIGKAVDKRGGAYFGQELCNTIKKRRLALKLSTIQLAELGHFYGEINHGGTVSNWEEGKGIPTLEQYNKLIDILGLEGNPLVEAEREVIGVQKQKGNIGYENENYAFEPNERKITKSATSQAKALDGSYGGFQPKPAVEVILVVMKPLNEKTFVEQALQNRKGISWLDDGRIPYESNGNVASNPKLRVERGCKTETGDRVFCQGELGKKNTMVENTLTGGRFPANLLVSDDVLNDGCTIKGGKPCNQNRQGLSTNQIYGKYGKDTTIYDTTTDSGSFSRYFDLDKWAQKTFPFLIVPKASKGEKNKGCKELQVADMRTMGDYGDQSQHKCSDGVHRSKGTGVSKQSNTHPTVKPLKLMSYLITLGSREGDTILDPFVGSGTTCLAAKLLNRKSVGYELKKQYCEIAEARCRRMILEM